MSLKNLKCKALRPVKHRGSRGQAAGSRQTLKDTRSERTLEARGSRQTLKDTRSERALEARGSRQTLEVTRSEQVLKSNLSRHKQRALDHSSSEARPPATCSRDPASLRNTQDYRMDMDQTGCLQVLKSNIVNLLITFQYAVVGLLFIPVCYALPDDRQQIMQFSSSKAELIQSKHRGIFMGKVEIDQGSTHIRAVKVITEGNTSNQLIKAILEGDQQNQAHYWTLSQADKPVLHAYADFIYYYPERHIIELVGHAKIEQGTDSFEAAQIHYDLLRQRVFSMSDGQLQTNIIIHPGKNHGIND